MHVSLFVFVAFLAHTHAEQSLSSRFTYDEALLEKIVRIEIRLEQVQEEVRATLGRFESDIQKTNQNVKEEFNHLNETTLAKVGELMKNLTESIAIPIIAFKATDIKNASPSVGEVLVFPKVLSNAGNGYDASSGIFTAPEDGLYLFTTQLCMYAGKYITAAIMVDEMEVGRCLSFDSSIPPCNTGDAIAKVEAGLKVLVKTTQSTGRFFNDENHLLSFSGALLHKGN